jgi:hypothetical protein
MNTLEYINYRIKSNNLDKRLSNIDWRKASAMNPMPLLKNIMSSNLQDKPVHLLFDENDNFEIELVHSDNYNKKQVKIIYQKNIEPDIFKWSGGTHDGSLIFSMEYVGEMFENLVKGASYNKNNIPESEYGTNENIWWNYDVIYYVSDLLRNTTYVDHVDKERGKMFDGINDEMAMAVQIKYIKHI